MHLDPRTLIVVTILSGLLLSGGLIAVSRGYLAQVSGVKRWAAATLLQALGLMVVGPLRGVVPDWLSIVVGNGLVQISLAWYLFVLAEFNDRPMPRLPAYALVLAQCAGLAWFATASPDLAARIVLISACTATLMLACAHVLWTGRGERPASHVLTAALFATGGIFNAGRGAYALIRHSMPDQAPFAPSAVNDVVYLAYYAIVILMTLGFVLMCNDRYIAEKARADEALRERMSFIDMIIDNAPTPLAYWTDDLRCTFANDGYLEWFGRSRDQMQGIDMQALLGDELYRLNKSHMRAALQGEARRFERALTRPDGVIGDFLVQYIPHRLNGRVAGFLAQLTDVTAIKRREEQLRLSDIALKAVSQGVAVTAPNLAILSVNTAFEDITGYRSSELLGRSYEIMHGGNTDPRTLETMRLSVANAEEFSGELLDYRKDGSTFWNETTISPAWDDSGRLSHFVFVARDVSARRDAEFARTSLETRLRESQEKEAVASLQAQLRESQKMEALGTLAGGIAHDFNNVLATILGNADLARADSQGSATALESLAEIRKAATRARDLVQQILSFSRRQPSDLRPTLLADVVDESVRLLRATLPARVTLTVRCGDAVPAVLADATQIQQVLINLVTNAMQALQGSPGRIGIRLDAAGLDDATVQAHPVLRGFREQHSGRTVRLAVSDDGPGMDAATLARIFEPFFTTKPVDEGTGLGLSVVHGIVQSHDGAIVVDSATGEGATFTLWFPAAVDEDMAAGIAGTGSSGSGDGRSGATGAQAIAPDSGGNSGRGQRILYLDDDEAMVFLVKRLLERHGYGVSAHTNQREALVALREDPASFDLVVTDYNMPGMSGLEVARAVRAIRDTLPVAVASGFIDETLRREAEGAGVRELIFKPTAVEEFCRIVEQLAHTLAQQPAPARDSGAQLTPG
ncbi:MAG: PAS domain-containing sensor histidine kinase [Betaproteobacteria bacterium]|nr:PAS domain-containing sensor histidine kinase [Betaproteobacteria bacterium]